MRELNEMQLEDVNGGIAPIVILKGMVTLGGYMGLTATFSNFGTGFGYGIYDATH
ncbi:class IIb bacteriocin, lactobin A/cerein 7B family [Aliiglaciecola sp. NS0011-25]|uniref:class IIb bacteriocin, lactobin A/cerein 7B family n=1 Tax=Aliiglaciecola sp. NS0011-25 TaxID=3127654 RepID=UPI003102C261